VHGLTVLAPDPMDALSVIAQSFGVGPMRANTIVFGLPSTDDVLRNESYVMALRSVGRLGMNVVAVSSDRDSWSHLPDTAPRRRVIDVWWTDDDTGRLSLLTAYLATRTTTWHRAKLRLVAPIPEGASPAIVAAGLKAMCDEVRIPATPVPVPTGDAEAMVGASSQATLVMIPMRLEGTLMVEAISGSDVVAVAERLPLVAAMMAGTHVDLRCWNGRPPKPLRIGIGSKPRSPPTRRCAARQRSPGPGSTNWPAGCSGPGPR
jgi:hypothetical protein